MRVLLIIFLLSSCVKHPGIIIINNEELKTENDSLREQIKRRDGHLSVMIDKLIRSDISVDSVLHISIVDIGKILNKK
jgi:hypothetical protein